MRRALLILLLPALAHAAAEHDHATQTLMREHGESLNFLVLGERFEQSDADTRAWEIQGWLGYDRDKLWLKTEGEYDTNANETEHSEIQLLYSRAVAPYWDLQAGLRRDDSNTRARSDVVLGVQGLAPYWFEIDAAVFLSEHGDVSTRFEAEYELKLTQRLILQPGFELNYSLADDIDDIDGAGSNEMALGLRLRYELLRELAPYVGVEWSRAWDGSAARLRAAGRNEEETRIVAGLRFWY
jgi:copper resistance protein B